MTNEERKAALEAIIYAADEPATIEQLAKALGEEKLVVQASLDELVASYAVEERGIEIRAVAGGYKLYTKPQQHDVVRRFIKSLRPPLRLTMPALETLAVIAYKQPVTSPEISEIRGVNTSGVISTLLDKRLITTAGRKEVIGRPILYKTSKEFLMRFGLSDLEELPSLKEFELLAREALGSDEGIAANGNAASEESLTAGGSATGAERDAGASGENAAAAGPALDGDGDMHATAAEAIEHVEQGIAEAEAFREHEALATAEGMPSGELDEDPPAPVVKSTAAGE
jgi:segregation and condensation protein B